MDERIAQLKQGFDAAHQECVGIELTLRKKIDAVTLTF
jgi:hypothetical protein